MTQPLLAHDGRTRAVSTTEEFDVYAGRGSAHPETVRVGLSGWLGNPFRVMDHGDAALDMFQSYFVGRVARDAEFRTAVLALRGKRLGCPGCPTGSPCHARIIADWIEANHG